MIGESSHVNDSGMQAVALNESYIGDYEPL